MFLKLPQPQRQHYLELLKLMGALSKLFSDSDSVYLDYRIAENLFCRSFGAKNVSRSDIAIDAVLGKIGVGVKTFTLANKARSTYEKIAEFNRNRQQLSSDPHQLIQQIATMRNERLIFAKNNYDINHLLYHCITRKRSIIQIFEFELRPIDINRLTIQTAKNNTILFDDSYYHYKFNLAKSTAYMQFDCLNPLFEIEVAIFPDLFALLEEFLRQQISTEAMLYPTAYLPLYSYSKKDDKKYIPERSGLNQWNAGGRSRQFDEVYIPIPKIFRDHVPNFFPPRDTQFTLHLPNGNKMMAKVCQDDGKALMSNPNRALGNWLLRDVLNLPEGELLTYDNLLRLGIDAVILQKIGELEYTIDFARIGTYEKFLQGALP